MLNAIQRAEPAPLSGVDGMVARVVMKSLALSPRARYTNATALQRDLESLSG